VSRITIQMLAVRVISFSFAANGGAVFLEDAIKFLQCMWVAEAVPHVAVFGEREERLGACRCRRS